MLLAVMAVGGCSGGDDDGAGAEADAGSLEGDYRAQADRAMEALALMYLDGVGLFGFGWWNSANALETTIDYSALTGSEEYLHLIGNTFERNADGDSINPNPNFLNELYDDEGWWALAWIKAYDLTGESRYLDMAKTIFDDMVGGWDEVCGGGVWWSKERAYKNAITNELFLSIAARLHRRTSAGGAATVYLEWAEREWDWFSASGMINDSSLVNDGLTADCLNNEQTAWTYNQGVILGGLTEMYLITEDAAVQELVTSDGILTDVCEPDCDDNGAQFKGIFMRNLSALHGVTSTAAYRDFIVKNADSIFENATSEYGEIGLVWYEAFDEADPIRQSSGLDAVNAAIPFTALAADQQP
jgi:predicted alpha-1,6-mannanase (GH76 family)